ncbi:unnamed protein product [Peniophora sp. CBMAI 1063]|nr:unnamed protein product [Peniophora sp. CBMAI 1063]
MLEPETDPQPATLIGIRVPPAAISAYMTAHHQASNSARLFLHHLDRALDGGRTPLALVYISGDEDVVDVEEIDAEGDDAEDAVDEEALGTKPDQVNAANPAQATTQKIESAQASSSSTGEDPPAYICFFVDTRSAPTSAAKLSNVPVPPAFARVQELLGVKTDAEASGAEGGVERLFVPRARVYAYDVAGILVDHLPPDA